MHRRRSGATTTALVAVGALLAIPVAAQGRGLPSASPPVPGGTYQGQTSLGAHLKIVLATQGPNGALNGTFAFPCAKVTASFRTGDGTFVAQKRNKAGKLIFRAQGRFAAVDRATGAVTKVAGSGKCAPSRFSAQLTSPAGVHSKTIRYGPYDVDPMQMMKGQTGLKNSNTASSNKAFSGAAKPCTDCYIVGMTPDLVYADGKVANWNTEAMLHHIVLFNTSAKDATCPGWPERFFASGNERTTFVLPNGYGYRVTPSANWTLLTDLMNMGMDMQTFYVKVTFYYVNAPASLTSVRPMWLDVDNCGDSEYSIPKGRSDTHWDYQVPASLAGKIVALGGHVHDEGVRIQAENVTQGKTICDSRAGYGTNPAYMGNIESMTGCVGDPLARINAGDTLRLHSIYNSDTAKSDVMGIMLGWVDTG